jgi:hypothetical protein
MLPDDRLTVPIDSVRHSYQSFPVSIKRQNRAYTSCWTNRRSSEIAKLSSSRDTVDEEFSCNGEKVGEGVESLAIGVTPSRSTIIKMVAKSSCIPCKRRQSKGFPRQSMQACRDVMSQMYLPISNFLMFDGPQEQDRRQHLSNVVV